MPISCSRCGRKLRNPPRMWRGLPYGPKCFAIVRGPTGGPKDTPAQSTSIIRFASWEEYDDGKEESLDGQELSSNPETDDAKV